ncbi:Oleosin family protein [Melia azedarach]|uniref:Oleosin family protein n=1 Tax=Melia azedarach TaxID=155640 RepID=A0ACC1Z0M5_MELAZ|nr:Oleosin family protein [Melia azedarach]
MADRDRVDRPQPHQLQVHPQLRYDAGGKALMQQRGPSASKVLAVMALLPVGGTLLALAGITLAGTIIGLLVTTPLFIIFSPVIVPAAIVIGLAVTGFFTSGAFGLTALSSLSWVLSRLRQKTGSMPEMADQAKRRVAGMADFVGLKTKEVGQEIQKQAHEAGKTGPGRT